MIDMKKLGFCMPLSEHYVKSEEGEAVGVGQTYRAMQPRLPQPPGYQATPGTIKVFQFTFNLQLCWLPNTSGAPGPLPTTYYSGQCQYSFDTSSPTVMTTDQAIDHALTLLKSKTPPAGQYYKVGICRRATAADPWLCWSFDLNFINTFGSNQQYT